MKPRDLALASVTRTQRDDGVLSQRRNAPRALWELIGYLINLSIKMIGITFGHDPASLKGRGYP